MKLKDLRIELDSVTAARAEVTDEHLRAWAVRLGIPLEGPEPSLEERHPRPWKVAAESGEHYSYQDGNGQYIRVEEARNAGIAAYNREPLLLEIAEAAEGVHRAWLLMDGHSEAHDKLENLLHRLRLEQREEKS